MWPESPIETAVILDEDILEILVELRNHLPLDRDPDEEVMPISIGDALPDQEDIIKITKRVFEGFDPGGAHVMEDHGVFRFGNVGMHNDEHMARWFVLLPIEGNGTLNVIDKDYKVHEARLTYPSEDYAMRGKGSRYAEALCFDAHLVHCFIMDHDNPDKACSALSVDIDLEEE